jgi:hypothetical protein
MVKILLVSFGGMIDGADFRRPAEVRVTLAFRRCRKTNAAPA